MQKPISEKNLWQRLPVRWRVIFLLLALIAASYGVRHAFPLTPQLRENQKIVAVDELSVSSAWESGDEAVVDNDTLPPSAEAVKKSTRVAGVYVSKLLPTGRKINVAFSEYLAADGVPATESATENSSEPASVGEASFVDSAAKKAGKIYEASRQKISEVWKKWRDGAPEKAPVLLIHGLGTDGRSLDAIAQELIKTGATSRVIVPDLPGAGASQRGIADYSIEAAAGEMFGLLDALEVADINVLGFGQGGGVAIYMAHTNPERVRSLALVSSTGAQEFELLGNHIVNKIVYTFHLGFFKLAQDVFPHFGLMDAGDINKEFARMLWDSDMSDLKKFIREWNGPVFLAHGEKDIITPAVAAQYTQKLAPQAVTYFVPDAGHHIFLEEPSGLVGNYSAFLEKIAVPAEAVALARAEPVPAAEPFPPIEAAHGMRVLVLMLVILVCTFVAEDPTCLASGLLVAQGLIEFVPATLACLIGIFIGDSALYLIGRFLGRPVLRKPPFKWIISEQEVDRMSDWFDKNPKGFALIVSSRFIPGSRVPTFVAAGIMRLNMVKLIILFFIAAAVWTPPLILLAEKVGAGVIDKFKEWHHNAAWIVIGAIVGLWLLTHYILPAFTWRGRRRHVMTRRQWTRHEFWPRFILAIPPTLHFLWLSIVHRSFTLFTLANRGLGADGGDPNGSKFDHYTTFFRETKNALVAAVSVKTIFVPANETLENRFEKVLSLMDENGIAFPCVMKPDIGDGGVGVCVVRSREHLRNWLEVNPDDAVLQEFVGGNEYEVVWSRRPNRAAGRIQTVVQKDFVVIKGDGERKLEELIWADDRGVSNGKLFSKLNFRDATRVLKAGETYALAPIGSRIKGANFVSRPELRAGTLADVLDRLADACGNVHYLVFDIRAVDDAALASGNGIRITGIKGAGATASTIFDGYVRMGAAYSRAFRQMNYCFAIGAEIRDDHSAKPAISAFRLFELWGTARGRSDNYVKLPHDV